MDLPPALRDRLIVVDDFLPADLALAMRREIDAHFAGAADDLGEVWRLEAGTDGARLRTTPGKVLSRTALDAFADALSDWSIETLGLARATAPALIAQIGGCHDDVRTAGARGRFGYVYSLTAETRDTIGGALRLYREPVEDGPLFDAAAPRFNRLVVFDARAPHAVETVAGSMDPRHGRLALQGFLGEGPPMAGGALPGATLADGALAAFRGFHEAAFVDEFRGLATFAIEVGADGAVADCRVILDRVLAPPGAGGRWPYLLNDLVGRFRAMRFPPAEGPSEMLIPISFGPPIDAG